MDFTTAINRTLGVEGGYVNDPNDPGGETKFGISKRAYPDVDIKNLTREQAVAIYKRDFWDRAHIDAMPALLQYQALDFAVNSGIEIAVRKLQFAAGVADDGHWGPVTQAAVAAMPGDRLVILFLAARLEFMTKLSNWVSAGKGWALRIVTDMRYAAQDLKGG
jgi:lysozyme family protein